MFNNKSKNQVNLVGRCAQDGVKRTATKTGKDFGSFTICTTKSYFNQDKERYEDRISWIPISSFNKHVVNGIEKLKKGDLVSVTAELVSKDDYSISVVAYEVTKLVSAVNNTGSDQDSKNPADKGK